MIRENAFIPELPLWEIENLGAEGNQKPEVTAWTGNTKLLSHFPIWKDCATVNIHMGDAKRSCVRSENDNYRPLQTSEYLNGLQQFYCAHGRNNQTVNVGDIVHIQDLYCD